MDDWSWFSGLEIWTGVIRHAGQIRKKMVIPNCPQGLVFLWSI